MRFSSQRAPMSGLRRIPAKIPGSPTHYLGSPSYPPDTDHMSSLKMRCSTCQNLKKDYNCLVKHRTLTCKTRTALLELLYKAASDRADHIARIVLNKFGHSTRATPKAQEIVEKPDIENGNKLNLDTMVFFPVVRHSS